MAILLDHVHLVSDTSVAELHVFAKQLGMRRTWFQDHRFPHYDVMSKRRHKEALRLGAHLVPTREIVRRAIRSESSDSRPTE